MDDTINAGLRMVATSMTTRPRPAEAGDHRATEAVLVVCTRSRAHLFERFLLPSLASAAAGRRTVVVDQSDDDATRALLDGVAGVSLITSPPGLSCGRNAGVSATTESIVAFSDDDVTLPPSWLDLIVASFDDDRVGAVLGRATSPAGELLSGASAGVYEWPRNPFGLGSGFNMAFRRAALDAAGPFDEKLGAGTPIGAAEDSDMIYRVMRAGFLVRCVDEPAVVHHDWRTGREEIALHFRYGQGVGAMTVKHARAGDRESLKIALRTIGDQAFWFGVHVVRRRWSDAGRHPAFVVGILVGGIRRWLGDRAR